MDPFQENNREDLDKNGQQESRLINKHKARAELLRWLKRGTVPVKDLEKLRDVMLIVLSEETTRTLPKVDKENLSQATNLDLLSALMASQSAEALEVFKDKAPDGVYDIAYITAADPTKFRDLRSLHYTYMAVGKLSFSALMLSEDDTRKYAYSAFKTFVRPVSELDVEKYEVLLKSGSTDEVLSTLSLLAAQLSTFKQNIGDSNCPSLFLCCELVLRNMLKIETEVYWLTPPGETISSLNDAEKVFPIFHRQSSVRQGESLPFKHQYFSWCDQLLEWSIAKAKAKGDANIPANKVLPLIKERWRYHVFADYNVSSFALDYFGLIKGVNQETPWTIEKLRNPAEQVAFWDSPDFDILPKLIVEALGSACVREPSQQLKYDPLTAKPIDIISRLFRIPSSKQLEEVYAHCSEQVKKIITQLSLPVTDFADLRSIPEFAMAYIEFVPFLVLSPMYAKAHKFWESIKNLGGSKSADEEEWLRSKLDKGEVSELDAMNMIAFRSIFSEYDENMGELYLDLLSKAINSENIQNMRLIHNLAPRSNVAREIPILCDVRVLSKAGLVDIDRDILEEEQQELLDSILSGIASKIQT